MRLKMWAVLLIIITFIAVFDGVVAEGLNAAFESFSGVRGNMQRPITSFIAVCGIYLFVERLFYKK